MEHTYSQDVKRALSQVESELTRLSAVKVSLQSALNGIGAIGASGAIGAKASAIPEKSTFIRRRGRRHRFYTPRGLGPLSFAKQALRSTTKALSTKELVEAAKALGWRPNDRARCKPYALMAASLGHLRSKGEVIRDDRGNWWTPRS